MIEEQEPELMQVIVRDRQEGKTTDLIKWLLDGYQQDVYPQWNRVIVCVTNGMVQHTAKSIMRFTNDAYLCSKSEPHLKDQCEKAHDRIASLLRKAVWNLGDLQFNARGTRADAFEYVVDDFDLFIQRQFNFKMPAIAAMTGKLYEPSVRD